MEKLNSYPTQYRTIIEFNSLTGSNLNKKILDSPRHSSAPIFLNFFQPLKDISLRDLTKWLQNNVVGYLQNKASWEVYPERLLYLYGLRGVGRLSTIMYYCFQHKINLIYVNPNYHEETMHAELFKTAIEKQPCIIYYDNVNDLVNTPTRLAPFVAMFDVLLDAAKHDVWVMLSGSNDLLNIPQHFAFLLARFGSVVYIPLCDNPVYRLKVIEGILRGLTNSSSYPYQFMPDPSLRQDWPSFLQKLNQASSCCGYHELWSFIVNVFRRFRQTVTPPARPGGSYHESQSTIVQLEQSLYPSISHFEAEFATLPFKNDSNCSDLRILKTYRNVLADSLDVTSCWNLYNQSHPAFSEDEQFSTSPPPSPPPPLILQNSQIIPPSPEDEFSLGPLKFTEPPKPKPQLPLLKSSQQLKPPSKRPLPPKIVKKVFIDYSSSDGEGEEEGAKRLRVH